MRASNASATGYVRCIGGEAPRRLSSEDPQRQGEGRHRHASAASASTDTLCETMSCVGMVWQPCWHIHMVMDVCDARCERMSAHALTATARAPRRFVRSVWGGGGGADGGENLRWLQTRSGISRLRRPNNIMWPHRAPPPPAPPASIWQEIPWPEYLYIAHAVLELILGLLKLRGRYSHEAPGARSAKSAMYVRHHGFSLLALALLGYLIWRAEAVNSPTGAAVSLVLFVFHGGAVAAFTHAWACGEIPLAKIVVPHLPFAVAFALHAMQ